MCEAAQGPTVPDVGERGPVQAGAWRRREKIAVLQCIKYEESLLSLLLSPHIPMPEKGEGDTLSEWQWGEAGAELGSLQAGKAARRGGSPQILLAGMACM